MGRLDHKLSGSTLMETVVATIIILGAFVVSSLVINNIARSFYTDQNATVENSVEKLHYLYLHGQLDMPLNAEYEAHQIYADKVSIENVNYIKYEIELKKGNQVATKFLIANE